MSRWKDTLEKIEMVRTARSGPTVVSLGVVFAKRGQGMAGFGVSYDFSMT
jgi:hypothetical protein